MREPHHLRDRFGVLAVDVKNGTLQHFRDVGGVRGRAALARRSGEAELVVHDDVQRAADRVARQLAHVQRFLHHPFAGESGIAVNEQQ